MPRFKFIDKSILLKQITNYHFNSNSTTLIESTKLASRQLQWLEESIDDGESSRVKGNIGEQLKLMVHEFTVLNKPLAYIIGNQPFHPLPLPLLTRPPTLIPRPETEHWTNLLSTALVPTFSASPSDETYNVLDIGTGTGCIPLGLYWALKDVVATLQVVGVDKELSALTLARANVERCLKTLDKGKWKQLGRERAGEGVKIVEGDLWSSNFVQSMRKEIGSSKGYDLVVSNPPYITRKDYEGLDLNVKNWEDRNALVGDRFNEDHEEELDDDGLVFYSRISEVLLELLKGSKKPVLRRPVVALEVGKGQSRQVEEMLKRLGLKSQVWKDPWDVDRTVTGWLD